MNEILDRINAMKEKINMAGRYQVNITDRNMDSSTYFFIWDDEHLILHAIGATADLEPQHYFPFTIWHIDYDQIEFINALYEDNK